MSNIEYDSELPYAFLNTSKEVVARFSELWLAERFEREIAVGEVVDTTPKPKIPEDAEFITWSDPYDNGEERIAMRYGHPANKVWRVGVDTLDELDLLNDWIGDAEVTVLVRKEET